MAHGLCPVCTRVVWLAKCFLKKYIGCQHLKIEGLPTKIRFLASLEKQKCLQHEVHIPAWQLPAPGVSTGSSEGTDGKVKDIPYLSQYEKGCEGGRSLDLMCFTHFQHLPGPWEHLSL